MKLKRLIRYLLGTKKRHLCIGVDKMKWIHIFIDTAYAVHHDVKSHTGECNLFGRGAIVIKAVKQKLNTTSSIETELVGNNNFIPSAIYASLFLDTQGDCMQTSVLHQDK